MQAILLKMNIASTRLQKDNNGELVSKLTEELEKASKVKLNFAEKENK
jgi:hypothetical protein